MSAAQPGAVIRLLQSVELDASGLANNQGALTLDKDLTLEGNGFTISSKADTFSVTGDNGGGPSLVNIVNSADVTLRNVNFDGARAAKHGLNIIGAGTVSLEDVEIAGCRWYAAVVSDAGPADGRPRHLRQPVGPEHRQDRLRRAGRHHHRRGGLRGL